MGNFLPVFEAQKQCKGCIYFKPSSGNSGAGTLMCHHMLITGKRRIDNDGVCESRTTPLAQVEELIEKAKKSIAAAPKKESKLKKRVLAVEDGIVFDSMTEAEKHYKLSHGRVHKVANNPNKMARGQHFVTV